MSHLLRHDRASTCPAARWISMGPDSLAYGVDGLEPCALVGNGLEQPFSWAYRVHCSVACREFRSRLATREGCLDEAVFWLRQVECPGCVSVPPAP